MSGLLPTMRGGSFSLKPFLDWLPLDNCDVLEIGCFAGEGSVEFLQCDKVRSLTCVDPFRGGYDDGDLASGADMQLASVVWMTRVWAARGGKEVSLTMDYIWPASKQYGLIYLDADHRYRCVHEDITYAVNCYGAKIIAGHDYGVAQHPGVKQAVDEIFYDKKIHRFPDYSWAVVL